MSEIQIFNSRGEVLAPSAFDAAAVQALPPARRKVFELFYAAAVANAAAEDDVKQKTAAVERLVIELREATEALAKIRPKQTFMDLWRQSVQGQ